MGGQSLEIVGVLAGIAAISLVVGGIGIMNIMLVSVTEAAATSALGGIIGILLGDGLSILATQVVERLMEESLTISPTLAAVALAFGISVGHRDFLRIPARQEGGTAQPHRRAALRLIHLGPAPPGPDITTSKECCI